jgi:hypothetical protein
MKRLGAYTERAARGYEGICGLCGDFYFQFAVHECACDVVPLERSVMFSGITLGRYYMKFV